MKKQNTQNCNNVDNIAQCLLKHMSNSRLGAAYRELDGVKIELYDLFEVMDKQKRENERLKDKEAEAHRRILRIESMYAAARAREKRL